MELHTTHTDTDAASSRSYISIMIQCLKKKEGILDQIIRHNDTQAKLFLDTNLDPDVLEKSIEEKGELIQSLNLLDEGFQQTFDRMRDEITQHREQYCDEIRQMQQLITSITEKGNTIQVQEQKNKKAADEHFTRVHRQINQTKANFAKVSQYYRNVMDVKAKDIQQVYNEE